MIKDSFHEGLKNSMKSVSFQTQKNQQIFIWQIRCEKKTEKHRCPEIVHIAAAFELIMEFGIKTLKDSVKILRW